MAENSKIEWTHHTFNPWLGCTKVAEGCKHCYAEQLMDTRYGKVAWGANGTRVLTSPSYWKQPLKWNRDAAKAGERRRIFCASLADVFEDWGCEIRDSHGSILHRCHNGHLVPCQSVHANGTECDGGCTSVAMPLTMDDVRRSLFKLIDATPHLDWLLLTKRPENVQRMWIHPSETSYESLTRKRYNVWLGTSIATQADADKNIPELLKCRDLSPVLFVSAEPLIGKVDLTSLWVPYGEAGDHDQGFHRRDCLSGFQGHKAGGWTNPKGRIDWLIIGGESGHDARPCDVAWIRSLKDQCAAAGVPCFVKQLGANRYDTLPTEPYPLKDAKGGDWSEWCNDLRVREFPKVTA